MNLDDRAANALDVPEIKFELVPAGDLVARDVSVNWLVKPICEAGDFVVSFGDPGSCKSRQALDMSLCVADGRPWAGFQTHQAPVIYLNGEGHTGFRRRLKAWEVHHGADLSGLPFYASTCALSLFTEEGAKTVSAAVDSVIHDAGPPGLVVIDTLTRWMGANENDAQDMAQFLAHIDQHLRFKYNATIWLVHHSPHGDKNRARGSTVLKAAADAEYRFERLDESVTMSCTKVKDHEPLPPQSFEITPVALPWADEDGAPISSFVLEHTEYIPQAIPQKSGLGSRQKNALDCLHRLEDQHKENRAASGLNGDGARVTLSDWRDELLTRNVIPDGRDKHKRFSEIRSALEKRCLIRADDLFVYTIS